MNEISIAQQYMDAWSAHNPKAVAALFSKNAIFIDPGHNGLASEVVFDLAHSSIGGFPDVSFDVVSILSAGDGIVVLEWIMRGTNTGSVFGVPPTGRTISVPGVDIIHVQTGKISSLKSYFDENTFAKQLGLA